MRAVLIVNPNATSTTAATRDLLTYALQSRVALTVQHTDHRGHAVEITDAASDDDVDVIIIHGGDGTVNEVVNGLLGEPGPNVARRRCAVAVVPGGAANVFARALGISPDPIVATNQLIDLLDEHQRGAPYRRIGLMDCGQRWGVFTAGMGVDGAVVAAVEKQRAKGRTVTAGRYIRVAVREILARARQEPALRLEVAGEAEVADVHMALVSNASPWTYVNSRPVWTNPDTTFDTGLGIFATTSMGVWSNAMLARRMLSRRHRITGRHLIRHDDVPWVRITAAEPTASQIDGDFVGMHTEMVFRAVPDVLDVMAPAARS